MRAIALFLAFLMAVLQGLGLIRPEDDGTVEAVYLGVENYGQEDVNREHLNEFSYIFEVDGEQIVLKIPEDCESQGRDKEYPVQNILKYGYKYRIKYNEGNLEYIREVPVTGDETVPQIKGNPGEKTILNLLKTAMMPVGSALYIYGGGWNWQDEGASEFATDIGVAPEWKRFFRENDAGYSFRNNEDRKHSYYPHGGYNQYYYAGLDCSGYLGWVLYNTFNTGPGGEGMVWSSTTVAGRLADLGYGTWDKEKPGEGREKLLPGDIVSIKGHVWMCVGTCGDGSILIVHSTPSPSRDGFEGGGVQLSAIGMGTDCEAYVLADRYMKEHCPEWAERYEVQLKSLSVYMDLSHEKAGIFTWDTGSEDGLEDPEGIRDMSPEEILELIFAGDEPQEPQQGTEDMTTEEQAAS
jgi:hypothetical protein